MHSLIKVFDHRIVAIHRGNSENQSGSIIYKGKYGQLHTINLDSCVENFQREYGTANGRCVGDRDITKGYFMLHTSGIRTIISFKRMYVYNRSGRKLMRGSRSARFRQFQEILNQAGYTTYDLS